jgi:alpha-ribazole phosphatase
VAVARDGCLNPGSSLSLGLRTDAEVNGLWIWRHPKAAGAVVDGEARCIGRTDLAVDRRRARRLASRICTAARRHGLPRVVWVSPLRRCRAVGEVLRGWGWQLHVDARLAEVDFGRWDGRLWRDIDPAEVTAWADELLHHAPGGGESLAQLAARAQAFEAQRQAWGEHTRLVVSHGGWINALLHVPSGCSALPASAWPAPPRHGQLVRWRGGAAPASHRAEDGASDPA